MKRFLLIALLGVFSITGCSKDDDNGEKSGPSTFPQLKGAYISQGSDIFRTIYTFYNSDVLLIRDYTKRSDETEWNDFGKGHLQWKITNNIFYTRSWENNSGTIHAGIWSDGKPFEYIDSENFKLDGKFYLKDEDYPNLDL